ncbi:MAG: HD domain-containing protein [Acidimicrobiaceae bacterium]|nr:HD domain-containing protein [Acidimicrobiaceae bacterium]
MLKRGLSIDDSSYKDWNLSTVISTDRFVQSDDLLMVLIDENKVIVDYNESYRSWFRLPKGAPTRQSIIDPWWHAVREDGSPFPIWDRPSTITLETGRSVSSVVMGVDMEGVKRRWLLVSTFAAYDEDRLKGVVSWSIDITDKIDMDRLMRLNAAMNRNVVTASDETTFMQQTCDALVKEGGFALARVVVASGSKQGLVEDIAASGATDFFYKEMTPWLTNSPLDLNPTGTALRTGLTQVANDLAHDSRTEPWRKREKLFDLASSVAIPLDLGDRRAVLNVVSDHPNAFDKKTLDGLEGIAREIGFAAKHVRSVQQLAMAFDGTLSALATMTESRDPYTAGHQNNVGQLGAEIAARLGLDGPMVVLVSQSGRVHDIGKIAVPSEILTRPGTLSHNEFELMKTHTSVGFDILSKASLPWPIAEVALQHHERMDGSGYPQGLRGDDISIPSRIIAVADVVEAIMHYRPYRQALGVDAALDEVARGAGTKYDATIVEACVEAIPAYLNYLTG